MYRRHSLLQAVFLAIAVSACTTEGATRTSTDYRDAPTLLLTAEPAYCASQQESYCQFSKAAFVNVAPNHGVIIGMPSGPISRFDSAGKLIAEYGRPGGGPGEYRFVPGAHVEPDGRVIVHDFGQSRRLSFAENGTSLSTHLDTPDPGVRDMALDARGLVVLRDPPGRTGEDVRSEILAYIDTLPPQLIAYIPGVRQADENGRIPIVGFFADAPRWAVESDTSILVASGPFLLVRRHLRDGKIVDLVRMQDVGNRSVTAADRERERELWLTAGMVQTPAAREVRARAVAISEELAAKVHPFTARLRTLKGGAFMLRETEVVADSVRWSMFDTNGNVVGQLRLAADADIVGGDQQMILLVNHDEFDVPIVAWHRLGVRDE